MNAIDSIPLDDLRTIEALAKEFPALLTVRTLRWQLRHRDANGLAMACVRVGKRLLISRSRYETWLATRAGEAVYVPRPAENPVLAALRERGLYKQALGDGRHAVTCPWVAEHTDEIDHGSTYFEPDKLHPVGGFRCLHGHCAERRIGALLGFLGIEATRAKGKAVIRIKPGEIDRIVDATERELAATGTYYARGGLIVTVSIDEAGNATTKAVSMNALTRAVSASAVFEHYDARSRGWTQCDPPPRHIAILHEADRYAHLPALRGITRQPYFGVDDKLVKTAGFDSASGMFGAFNPSEFSVPEHPTEAQLQEAMDDLAELLDEFAFAEGHDFAAAYAAIITAAVRPTLALAPMFHVRAPVVGSGKSYLAQLIAAFAGPDHALTQAFPHSDEEATKVLLASLLMAPAVILFDNLITDLLPLKSLATALTEECITARVLGYSKTATVSTATVFLSTGNNVSPVRDMTRRVITITLDPQCEQPAARRFKADPVALVWADRGKHVSAALTIVRAYLDAGAPEQDLRPLASFGAWSRTVRSALVWLGMPDPAESLYRQILADPDRELLGRLLHELHERYNTHAFTTAQIVKDSSGEAGARLEEVLKEIAGDERKEETINRRRLGKWVARHAGRIVNGLRLVRVPGANTGHSESWRVDQMPEEEPTA